MSNLPIRLIASVAIACAAGLSAQDTIFNNPFAGTGTTGFGVQATVISDIDGGGRPDVAISTIDPTTSISIVSVFSSETGAVLQDTGNSFGPDFGTAMVNVGNIVGGPEDDLLVSWPSVGVLFLLAGDLVGGPGSMGVSGVISLPTNTATGEMVLISGTNIDGVRRVALGDPGANAVHLIDVVTLSVTSTITDTRIGSLGAALASDGNNRLVVGAPTWSSTVPAGPSRGYVNIYKLSGGTATLARTYAGPATGLPREFGRSLANVGDLNNDGLADYAVLCPSPNAASAFAGILSENNPVVTGTFNYNFATTLGRGRIASMGDIDGDNRSDVILSDGGNLRVLTTPAGATLAPLTAANAAGNFDGAVTSGRIFGQCFVDVLAAQNVNTPTATVRVQPIAAWRNLPNPPACSIAPPAQRPTLGTVYSLQVSTTSTVPVTALVIVDFGPPINAPFGNGTAYVNAGSGTAAVFGFPGLIAGSPLTFNTSVIPTSTSFLNVCLVFQAAVITPSSAFEVSNAILARIGQR